MTTAPWQRLLAEITPIKAPIAPKLNATSSVIRTKGKVFTGATPPNRGPAVRKMMAETISVWKMVLSTGMIRIEIAGTPLIL